MKKEDLNGKRKFAGRLVWLIMAFVGLSVINSAAVFAEAYAPSGAEITYYEAEDAAREGNLWEGSYSLASGGKVVTQISVGNSLTFTVDVPEAGDYDVQVHYATYNNYTFKFIVNGDTQNPVSFECPSNYSWGESTFGTITTTVRLDRGANELKLASDETNYTDTRFDRIGVYKAKDRYNDRITFGTDAEAPSNPNTIWYRTLAEKWAESVPLGNGRIGAMIWGGVYEDEVSLNEVTCWSGEDHADKGLDNPDGPEYLGIIQDEFQKENPNRTLIAEYFNLMGGETNDGFGTSRPFGKLKFNYAYAGDEVDGYIRRLDLNESISYVNYSVDGTNYSREAFVSNPAQVMVMKYSADQGGKIAFDVNFALEEPAGGSGVVTVDGESLAFDGIPAAKSEIRTHARLKAVTEGGSVVYDEYGIHITGADEATLILALGTTFDNPDVKQECSQRLEAALAKDYETLKNEHISDVKPRFERMSIDLGGADAENIPTDERVENIRNGAELDAGFTELWYQYARYLTLAGSREDSPLPMHLQGIWNDNVSCNMIWNCDYHLDINIQMNQWMSNASNLSEGELPIFKFMNEYLIPSGKETARIQYGKDGWTVGIVTNPWGYSGNTGTVGAWEGSTTSGAWLAQEIMNYFDYTWDTEFLETEGLPMLKETADFFLDYLVEYSQDINPADGRGYLVTIPGSSPENGDLEVMPAYDRTIIYDIFYQVLRCYDILDMPRDEYYDRVKSSMDRLAPYKISKFGQLAEWPYNDYTDGASEHRTTSNLLGVFPYDQITPDKTPDLARAALLSMNRKFELDAFEHTEWTCVNAQGMYARFKDGEKAFDYLKRLAVSFTWPNLLSISPEGIGGAETDVYIIDGVLGMAAGVNEMLLQSHSERLEFVPALPEAWDNGSISGMKARGAFEVDFSWEDYKLKTAKIESLAGNTCRIYKNAGANWTNVSVFLENGEELVPVETSLEDNCIVFETEVGGVYLLKTNGGEDLTQGYMINDTDPRIVWNGFTPSASRGLGDYLDDVHFANGAGASFELEFTGTGIDVLTERHGYGQKVEIFIDGESQGVYSANTSDTDRDVQYPIFSINGLEYGRHTISGVTVSENENEQYLELDAFVAHGFYAPVQNDDSPQITYTGSWQVFKDRHQYNINNYYDDIHYTNAVGDSAVFEFEGTGVELVGERYVGGGTADVAIDGINVGEINFGAPSNGARDVMTSVYYTDGLANTKHTLEITSKGGDVIIDAFIVKNSGEDYFEDGVYEIGGLQDGGLLTDEDGAAVSSAKLGGYNQKWYVETIDDTYCHIINANSGLLLGTNELGYSVEQEARWDGSQEWNIMPSYRTDGYFVIENKKTGKYLQVDAGWPYDGAGVSPYEYSRQDHYEWKLNDSGDFITLQRNLNDSIIEIVVDENSASKGRALINPLSAGEEQKWRIESLENGEFMITNIQTGRVLGYRDSEVITSPQEDLPSNRWRIESTVENAQACYAIYNVESGAWLYDANWSLTKTTASSSGANTPAAFAHDLKIDGDVRPGGVVSFSYEYKNAADIPEGDSEYSVYALKNSSESIDGKTPFASGKIKAGEAVEIAIPDDLAATDVLLFEAAPKSADGSGAKAYKLAAHPGEGMEYGVYTTAKGAWEAASRIRHRNYQWQELVPAEYVFECDYETREDGTAVMMRIVEA